MYVISALMGPAVFLAFLAYYGNESISVAATLIILAVAMSGCGSSAIMANIIDISPNHAGNTYIYILNCECII